MRTTDLLFHPLTDYKFVRQDTREFVCSVEDRAWTYEGRGGFYRLTIDKENKNCLQSVYEEINGILCPINERTLRKDDPVRAFLASDEIARQEYQGIAQYAPPTIAEGEKWHYQTRGRWTWREMPDGPISGAGAWEYDVIGFLLFGRLDILEVWTETVDGDLSTGSLPSGEKHLFNRHEVFTTDGFLGFDDELVTGWNGMVVRQ